MPSTVERSAAGTGRAATASAIPLPVQARATPISTPAPIISAKAPWALAITASPAR